ncbi:MAG: hypothetical protein ACYSW3_26795 [Planctomycetota bacterium]
MPRVEPRPGDQFGRASADLEMVNFAALRRAIRDLAKTFPTRYTKGDDYLRALERYQKHLPQIKEALKQRDKAALKQFCLLIRCWTSIDCS